MAISAFQAVPFILTNGNIADATQVMADLNQIINNGNAGVVGKATLAPVAGNLATWVDTSGQLLQDSSIGTTFTPSTHPNQGGVRTGQNVIIANQNAIFQDVDNISIASFDNTTRVNNWTVSGTITVNDVVNLKLTYTPTGGSQKTVTISVTVTSAIANASPSTPFVLNGFSATTPHYAICLQMQQNYRTNATLLADWGTAIIAPTSFTLANIAVPNFPVVGTSTFSFNLTYPQVATGPATLQATVTTGTEVVTPSAVTNCGLTIENNPYFSLGRLISGRVPLAGDYIGAFYVTGGDSGSPTKINTQYTNAFTIIQNSTTGAWSSQFVLGTGNWPQGTGCAAFQFFQGLTFGSVNTFPTGNDKGFGTINLGTGYFIQGGGGAIGSAQLTSSFFSMNNNVAASPAAPANSLAQLVQLDATASLFTLDTFGAASTFVGRRADGTNGAKTGVIANDVLASFAGQGFDGTAYTPSTGVLRMVAAEAFSASARGTDLRMFAVANTTTTLAEKFRVTGVGDIMCMAGGGAALPTTTTSGFLTLTNCAGAPTGTPLNAGAGLTQVIYDSTNKKIWFWDQPTSTWKGVTVA